MGLGSKIRSHLQRKPKIKGARDPEDDGQSSSPSATSAANLISTSTTSAPASGLGERRPPATAIAQSLPRQSVPPVEQPSKPPAGSAPSLAPPVQPPSSGVISSTPSNNVDPWALAYELATNREPELMADYYTHLLSLQDSAAVGGSLFAPQFVESIVQQLLEAREKKQWQVTLMGKDIKIREQAERLAKFLLWSDPIVKNAVSTQPYAALAWSGVSLLLQLLTSSTTQNEAMLNGFNSIGDIQVYWRICEETYLDAEHQEAYKDLIDPIAKLYSYISEYQARVICHLSRAQLSRAWQNMAGWNDWVGKAREIDKLSKRCSEYISPLNENEIRDRWGCQLKEIQTSCEIQKDILQTMKEGIQDEKERRLFKDLARAAGNYESHKNRNPERVHDTCKWFLEDERFCKWRDSRSSHLLWVSAGPGRGKSVLTRSLIDEGLLTPTTITITSSSIVTSGTASTVCYFFFKDGEDGRMDGAHALCAILLQLFKNPPTSGLIEHALQKHRENDTTLTQKFSELWRILVDSASSPNAGEIVCVLDALDECKEDSRQEIIETLKKFYCPRDGPPSPSRLKFLVTSRPYEDLEVAFGKYPATAAYWRCEGDEKVEQIRQEIDLVIDARVQEIAAGFTDDDKQRISKRLKSVENRTYLWLHLIFDIIQNTPSRHSRRSDIEKLLSDLPLQVSNAYEQILSRSTDESQTKILLQIVLAAAQPLTLDEANFALTLALEEEQYSSHLEVQENLWPRDRFRSTVTNLCGLFLSVYNQKLSFIHQTAREYLTHREQRGTWQGCLSMPESHRKMSLCCIRYLLLPDLSTTTDNISADNQQHAFLPYAAAHWPLHYISQEDCVAIHSRKDARTLCTVAGRQANIWMPIYFRKTYQSEDGWTNLALASSLGLKLVVKDILCEENINMDLQCRYGTALQVASERGHKEIVQILLSKGADVNSEGQYGTALYRASDGGYKEIVQMLLDKGADVNSEGPDKTALYKASNGGYKEIVQMLLDKGADVNSEGRYGTALQLASGKGYKEIVQMLLDKGADVNSEGRYGTALYRASNGGYKEIVQILLSKGADVNSEGQYGTALYRASDEGHKEIVQMLLDKGADVNSEGQFRTVLQRASGRGHKEIVQMLLDKGADINSEGQYGTALQLASGTGQKEIVQMLLDKGADVNSEGPYGTALQLASVRGHKEIVQMLLDKGAHVNSEGRYGTALQRASAQGYKEIVQMLLSKGADVNSEGPYGTALQLASVRGHKEIVQMLQDKGGRCMSKEDMECGGNWA